MIRAFLYGFYNILSYRFQRIWKPQVFHWMGFIRLGIGTGQSALIGIRIIYWLTVDLHHAAVLLFSITVPKE